MKVKKVTHLREYQKQKSTLFTDMYLQVGATTFKAICVRGTKQSTPYTGNLMFWSNNKAQKDRVTTQNITTPEQFSPFSKTPLNKLIFKFFV